MSTKVSQTDDAPTVKESELISNGPDNLSVERVEGEIVHAERYDGEHIRFTRDELARCDCGMLMFGGEQCYGCYKKEN